MDDVAMSLDRYRISNGWLFGERFNRIGDPFSWIDGDALPTLGLGGSFHQMIQYLAMSGEIYELPKSVVCNNYLEVLSDIETKLSRIFHSFLTDPCAEAHGLKQYIKSTASVKAQDYAIITNWVNESKIKALQGPSSTHLDIGPGLGANVLYSVPHLRANYFSLEAHPLSYSVQRHFFMMICALLDIRMNDLVFSETMGENCIRLGEKSPSKITLLGSWQADTFPNESVDLVTATWVLNEVSTSGIFWIIFHVARVLKLGGVLYVRDSNTNKIGRHSIDIDVLLESVGFYKLAQLNVKNRIDLHGIPRIYIKKMSFNHSGFLDFYNANVSPSHVHAHGPRLAQVK